MTKSGWKVYPEEKPTTNGDYVVAFYDTYPKSIYCVSILPYNVENGLFNSLPGDDGNHAIKKDNMFWKALEEFSEEVLCSDNV